MQWTTTVSSAVDAKSKGTRSRSPQVPLPNSVASSSTRCFGVARPGFEPGQTEPKSVVLPLHYRAPPEGEVIYRMGPMTGKVQSPMRLGISHEQSLSRFFPWSYGEPQPSSCSTEDCAGARLGGVEWWLRHPGRQVSHSSSAVSGLAMDRWICRAGIHRDSPRDCADWSRDASASKPLCLYAATCF